MHTMPRPALPSCLHHFSLTSSKAKPAVQAPASSICRLASQNKQTLRDSDGRFKKTPPSNLTTKHRDVPVGLRQCWSTFWEVRKEGRGRLSLDVVSDFLDEEGVGVRQGFTWAGAVLPGDGDASTAVSIPLKCGSKYQISFRYPVSCHL